MALNTSALMPEVDGSECVNTLSPSLQGTLSSTGNIFQWSRGQDYQVKVNERQLWTNSWSFWTLPTLKRRN